MILSTIKLCRPAPYFHINRNAIEKRGENQCFPSWFDRSQHQNLLEKEPGGMRGSFVSLTSRRQTDFWGFMLTLFIQSPTDLAVSLLANRFLQCHDGGEPFIIWTAISYQADTPKGTLPGESGNRSKNAVGISKQWLVENGIMDCDISPYQCRYQYISFYLSIYLPT